MLDRCASITNVADTRHKLVGLHLEHTHNASVIKHLQNYLNAFLDEASTRYRKAPVHRLRHVALDSYLATPMLSDQLDVNSLLEQAQMISVVNEWLLAMQQVSNQDEIARVSLTQLSLLETNIAAFVVVTAELIEMLGPLSQTS